MDNLPGLQRGVNTAVTDSVKPIKKMVGRYAPVNGERRSPARVFTLRYLILAVLLVLLVAAWLFLLLIGGGLVAVCVGKACSRRGWQGIVV
jgi:nitrogen fixation/metabolism regulation signal transduction histidine kinase